MAAPPVKEIRYVCIARANDHTIIAQHFHVQPAPPYGANIKAVLGSPAWAKLVSDRLTLEDAEVNFYFLSAGPCVYIAAATKAYPFRLVYDSVDRHTEGVLSGVCPRVRVCVCCVHDCPHLWNTVCEGALDVGLRAAVSFLGEIRVSNWHAALGSGRLCVCVVVCVRVCLMYWFCCSNVSV